VACSWTAGEVNGTGVSSLPKAEKEMSKARIEIPKERLSKFCQTNRIERLSLFGSVLSDAFGPDSDVDVLVEFKPGTRIGLIQLMRLEFELGEILFVLSPFLVY
jgi:predicted nucleotidyltransferase